ncbi:MAG: prolipoprotein diacylglyceryl transferase [Prevotellaceae bacterium]|jgi:prolipoprotein diacylglyceryl transferase|nr:prolipoprotein diacylglyceryl transferase [Prevotellaceae bacterium]
MIQLLSIKWNVDPVMFSLGSIHIRYYSICWLLCFFVSYVIFRKIFKKENLKRELLDKLTINYVIPFTFIGARLGHCLFYEGAHYLKYPWEIILPFHDGKFTGYAGLASHGAALGILFALWLFCRKYRKPYIWSLDRIAIAVPVAGAIVRLGNLMNSEVYGHATDLPWGFVFVRAGETAPAHPSQIYEMLAYLLLFAVLYYLFFKKDLGIKMPGIIFGIFLMGLFTARFLIEFVKENQSEFEEQMLLNMGQWLSLPFIIAGAVILVYCLLNKIPVNDKSVKSK